MRNPNFRSFSVMVLVSLTGNLISISSITLIIPFPTLLEFAAVSMTPEEVIHKKRDRGELSRDEIASFIRGYMASEIADYHVSAWLMAVYLNGMTTEETL